MRYPDPNDGTRKEAIVPTKGEEGNADEAIVTSPAEDHDYITTCATDIVKSFETGDSNYSAESDNFF